jgi:hypothetical protein
VAVTTGQPLTQLFAKVGNILQLQQQQQQQQR